MTRFAIRRRPVRLVSLSAAVIVLLVAAGAWLLVARTNTETATRSAHPNIVFILVDDQRGDGISTMPNVQSLLAGHGITFSNFFDTTPSCCPSRTSILTGQYSHHTHVYDGNLIPPPGGALVFHDHSTLATWLHDDGYETALIGKYLNEYGRLPSSYVPPGWDEWDAIAAYPHEDRYYGYALDQNGKIVRYGTAPSDYSTTVLTAKAVSFIDEARQPFFLYLATVAPHVPATPAPGDEHAMPPAPLKRAPSFDQANVSKEPWGSTLHRFGSKRAKVARSLQLRMYRSSLAVDRSVKQIVDALRSRGELNESYIFYASDNGYLWGEHRVIGKLWPFEESIRAPLVVRVPGTEVPGTDSHLVLNIDLASTFTQLAGTVPGLPQDGRSLVPLLQGRSPPWRTAFVEEYLGTTKGGLQPPDYVCLRTVRYMYVEYHNGWRDLYDIRSDPYELNNLVGDTSEQAVVARLSRKLQAMFARPPEGSGQSP